MLREPPDLTDLEVRYKGMTASVKPQWLFLILLILLDHPHTYLFCNITQRTRTSKFVHKVELLPSIDSRKRFTWWMIYVFLRCINILFLCSSNHCKPGNGTFPLSPISRKRKSWYGGTQRFSCLPTWMLKNGVRFTSLSSKRDFLSAALSSPWLMMVEWGKHMLLLLCFLSWGEVETHMPPYLEKEEEAFPRKHKSNSFLNLLKASCPWTAQNAHGWDKWQGTTWIPPAELQLWAKDNPDAELYSDNSHLGKKILLYGQNVSQEQHTHHIHVRTLPWID